MPSFALKLLLALGLLMASAAAEAQNAMPRIGYLMDRGAFGEFDEAFLRGLRDHGYIPGQTIAIEYRWSQGVSERLPALAADFVQRRVALIVTQGAASTLAARNATTTIPIVMASSQDAVADGLVASLARPGGNVTGRSVYAAELTPKRLELLKELLPALSRVGVLCNVFNPGCPVQLREAQAAGNTLGIAIDPLNVRLPEGLDAALAATAEAGAGAILILSDNATISHRSEIAAAAQRHHLATMFANKAYLQGGGLMSYGPDLADSFRRTAVYVDRILRGAKPADLPVEQPTRFELVINLPAARSLGITVPPSLLALADGVIE